MAKGPESTRELNDSVYLCWWRRDIVFLVRVKILAWEDRAKAQTAATVQYNSPPQRPFKRTLLSARLLYTSEWSASLSSSFFFILKRTVFIGDT